MKNLLAALAVTVVCLVGLSTRADAGHGPKIGFSITFVSGYASCGCPHYTKRVCRGYDRYHRPVFNHYRQPFQCKCKGHGHYKHEHKGHSKQAKKYYKEREKAYKEREKAYKKYHKKAKKRKKCH